MKIEDLMLTEAPIPDDWDDNVFLDGTYSGMIRYAKQRAEQVGRGSSRTAFRVNYQGRPTVLKIANSSKGLTQNEEEANLLGDNFLMSIGIVIPMIDYDERSSRPRWIHQEYADKITERELSRFLGHDINEIVSHLDYIQGRNNFGPRKLPDEVYENEHFLKLASLVSDFGLPASDLSRKANWGIYRGNPVILDLGFTDVTSELY